MDWDKLFAIIKYIVKTYLILIIMIVMLVACTTFLPLLFKQERDISGSYLPNPQLLKEYIQDTLE